MPNLMKAIDLLAKDIATRSFIEKHGWEPRWRFRRNGENPDRLTYISSSEEMPKYVVFNDPQKYPLWLSLSWHRPRALSVCGHRYKSSLAQYASAH